MRWSTFLWATLSVLLMSPPAMAQLEDEDEEDEGELGGSEALGPEALAEMAREKELEEEPQYGIGLRLRYVGVPKGVIELFLEEAASGVGNPGFGLDFIRRKGDFEIAVGFEYESLSGDDGIYIENGGGLNQPGTVDFVEYEDFGWFTIDAAFVFHKELAEQLALRYGGGIGIGILTGDVLQTDANCGANPQTSADCTKPSTAAQFEDPADTPPVFPVINMLVGLQYRPTRNIALNLEGGLRTAFYGGLGAQYLF